MPDELPDLDLRKEWTRLRALLYETHDLALCTDERDGHRWLTDRFVLLDVTGSIAVEGVPDGVYKLVQSKGFQVREGAVNYLDGGIVDYLTNVERDATWTAVMPSEWSVAEHPGKAMLFVIPDGEYAWPCLMGESTWTALNRHYMPLVVEYNACVVSGGHNLFRVKGWTGTPDAYDGYWAVVAYVAGIRIPDGQEAVAQAIAKAVLDSRFN